MHSRENKVTLTEQYPWVVAFAFGLVHGLGFAGALAEVGLPQQEIPITLLMFNIGVVLLLIASLQRYHMVTAHQKLTR